MHLLMTRRVWTLPSLRTQMLSSCCQALLTRFIQMFCLLLCLTKTGILLTSAMQEGIKARGIVVKTLMELESHVINAFSDGKTPPLYHGMAWWSTSIASGFPMLCETPPFSLLQPFTFQWTCPILSTQRLAQKALWFMMYEGKLEN